MGAASPVKHVSWVLGFFSRKEKLFWHLKIKKEVRKELRALFLATNVLEKQVIHVYS